jgi:c-di-GMP-related signal transduction protein
MSFLIAKQPVFDREGRIIAYEMLALEDAYNDPFLINIKELTGIYRSDLFRMLKDAYEKVDYIFNL